MRPLRTAPWVLLFACALPAVSPADDFTDFRIPDHFGGSWSAGISGTAISRSHNEEGDAARERSLEGNLNGDWSRFHDSDRNQWYLRLAAGVGGRRRTDRDDQFLEFTGPTPGYIASRRKDRERLATESVQISASTRSYPWSIPVGWDVGGHAALLESQDWFDQLQFQTYNSGFASRAERSLQQVTTRYEERVVLDVTLGLGRVRDATPVFQAILLEERLQRDGALAHPLSPAGRQRIADLLALRGDFNVPHDLPGKFFWSELESALREEGALADSGFDAYALQHVQEPLVVAGPLFYRPVGWFVGPTLTFDHQHLLIRRDDDVRTVYFDDGVLTGVFSNHAGTRSKLFVDRTLYGATGEFHRPLGTRTQLSLGENVAVDLGPDPDGLDAYGFVLVQRLIAERWFGELRVSHDRVLFGDPDYSYWDAAASGSIDYYLEDFVRASLELRQSWRGTRFEVDPRRDLDFSVFLGLTFGRGRLDAPGRIHPQRALN